MSEGQIIQPATTVVGQRETERSIPFLYTLNCQHYPLKCERGFMLVRNKCEVQEAFEVILWYSMFINRYPEFL